MAVQRQLNVLGQMRIDVPHIRMIESAIAADFDVLAGGVFAGSKPTVVKGFQIAAFNVGTAASTLRLVTSGGIILHPTASEAGTAFKVPDERLPESLSITNTTRVTGGFTPSQTNYVGIDLVRTEDPTTADVVQFLDATTLKETAKTVPLARNLDYKIVITTTPFTAMDNVCPVAIVVTDANNNIVSVADARSMFFRLASGGVDPNPLGVYGWPEGREEVVGEFTGGDKAITNLKDWMAAVMYRLWEVTGGEYWYSDTTDRNLKFIRSNPTTAPNPLGDNFVATVSGPNINVKWKSLSILLTNSTASLNIIADNAVTGVDLADGECLYVDINRYVDGATLTPAKGLIDDLGTPTRVGSRYVIVWRRGDSVYSRGNDNEVGRSLAIATTSVLGGVLLASTPANALTPYVAITDAPNGSVLAAGLTRGTSLPVGDITIGFGANDRAIAIRAQHSNPTSASGDVEIQAMGARTADKPIIRIFNSSSAVTASFLHDGQLTLLNRLNCTQVYTASIVNNGVATARLPIIGKSGADVPVVVVMNAPKANGLVFRVSNDGSGDAPILDVDANGVYTYKDLTVNGHINIGAGKRMYGLSSPVANDEPATKQYADNIYNALNAAFANYPANTDMWRYVGGGLYDANGGGTGVGGVHIEHFSYTAPNRHRFILPEACIPSVMVHDTNFEAGITGGNADFAVVKWIGVNGDGRWVWDIMLYTSNGTPAHANFALTYCRTVA